MYKKAGIIISITLILLALGIFIIASLVSGDGSTSDTEQSGINAPAQTAVSNQVAPGTPVNTTAQTTMGTAAPVVSPVQTTTTAAVTKPTPTDIEQPAEQDTSSAQTQGTTQTEQSPAQQAGASLTADQAIITKIEASTLPSYSDESDFGTVVGRKIYAYNGQLIFSLLINTTTHGQLEYFTTLTNYNLADGERLEVTLRVYQAQNGNFPSIISVSSAS